jgi:hypothetical protein
VLSRIKRWIESQSLAWRFGIYALLVAAIVGWFFLFLWIDRLLREG